VSAQITFKNKKLKASSKRWLQRHMNDHYVEKAKKAGYSSRAAFKLLELDDKYKFMKSGQTVIDLGAAPGGWSQIIAQRVQSPQAGKVIAIDILEMNDIPGVHIITGDFLSKETYDKIAAAIGNEKVDGVVSDMAPNTTGHKKTDHLRLMGLVSPAYDFAKQFLKKDGYFIAKLFEGGAQKELLDEIKKNFTKVRHVKPPASRKNSSEMYLLATGYKDNEI